MDKSKKIDIKSILLNNGIILLLMLLVIYDVGVKRVCKNYLISYIVP